VCTVTEPWDRSNMRPPISFVDILSTLALALLDILQGLHVAVKSMSVVSSELGVSALQRGVTRSLGLLDTVPVRLARLVVLRGVLGLRHCCCSFPVSDGDGPTSLAYIVPLARGCSPWRPDAVMSTTGRGRYSVLHLLPPCKSMYSFDS